MSAKKQEINLRVSRFQRKHTSYFPKFEVMETPHDREELIDANGNITTKDRDFSEAKDYRDYSVEVLLEVNPAMLTGNPLSMSTGTPIEATDKVSEYMSRVNSNYDTLEQEAFDTYSREQIENINKTED